MQAAALPAAASSAAQACVHRKQEMERRVKAAKLQKDCLAAQEKHRPLKTQVDALAAELTATASEQITAANDRIRAEAEQKRLKRLWPSWKRRSPGVRMRWALCRRP